MILTGFRAKNRLGPLLILAPSFVFPRFDCSRCSIEHIRQGTRLSYYVVLNVLSVVSVGVDTYLALAAIVNDVGDVAQVIYYRFECV
jgi:hypothetical protein